MVLPKEHGTWLMFFLPVLLGTFVAGYTWWHVPLFVGWFFLYMSSVPLLNILRNIRHMEKMRPWFISYVFISLFCLIPVFLMKPQLLWLGVILLPLFLCNVYFIKTKNERSIWNDTFGIMIFSLGSVAAYVIGKGNFSREAFDLYIAITTYFIGVAFYVKSLIRERTNSFFIRKSLFYHVIVFLIPFLIDRPWLVLAYVPSFLKNLFTSRKKPLKPMTIGIIEIVNGIVFFILCMTLL